MPQGLLISLPQGTRPPVGEEVWAREEGERKENVRNKKAKKTKNKILDFDV